MLNKYILICVALLINLSVVLSIQASATIVRNNTEFPVNVTVYFGNGGIGKQTIASKGSTDMAGEIKKLDVYPPGTQSSIKPVVCDGVLSLYAIDIGTKEGVLKCE